MDGVKGVRMSDGLWTEVKMTSLRLGVPVQTFVSGWLAHAVEVGQCAGHGSDVRAAQPGGQRGSAARRRMGKSVLKTDAVATARVDVAGVGKVTVSHEETHAVVREEVRRDFYDAITRIVGGAGTAVDRGGAAVADDAGSPAGDVRGADGDSDAPVRELTVVVDDGDLF